ncbi:MAG: IS701 family transposase [Shimia sp.]|nr:IS701 family transposase [Shimia sp.]
MPLDEIEELDQRLVRVWKLFKRWMRTQTRDTSEYGLHYLSGLLRMDSRRNMANVGRQTGVDEQNMQHFMSNSPWSSRAVIEGVQEELKQRGELSQGAMLLLDESADDKAGDYSVGAGRQYNGRRGKVDNCQVGVFLTLAKGTFWTWIDGEVFLPERWFSDDYADHRRRAGIPPERTFMTKVELGWQMIQRVRAQGVPFEAVACDTLYGRSTWFRDRLDEEGLEYYADVPANTQVYLSEPQIGVPQSKRGKKAQQDRVLSPKVYRVDQLRHDVDTHWQTVEVRASERGFVRYDFAVRRVWTVRDDGRTREELLIIRREGKKCTYTLSNASIHTPIEVLARRKSQRFFIERSNQDAKSEIGWDEFQATKLLAWEHQLAMTLLASWFIAEIKLDWAAEHERDPALLDEYDVTVLPALSVANVRAMLCAAMPLPQLSPLEAATLVVKHLDNRTCSRKSRLKNQPPRSGP